MANQTKKKEIRIIRKTYSGDDYSGTKEQWESYWKLVEAGEWDEVQRMEEGFVEGFSYAPEHD